MSDRLIIIGASGHGKVACDIASQMNRWKEILFLDDNTEIDFVLEKKRIGVLSELSKFIDNTDFFVAIGNNQLRSKISNKLLNLSAAIITLVHPNAVIGQEVKIGVGSIIMAGAVINASTTIGVGCIVNTNASIDHDSYINDYVHISPGVVLAGSVFLGNLVWIGLGAKVINNISITDNTIVGAGALVVKDISESGTYIGMPARKK
jgi:sugar O-acyltransferase (sialic acid O-acetyltransferase NeuD family)